MELITTDGTTVRPDPISTKIMPGNLLKIGFGRAQQPFEFPPELQYKAVRLRSSEPVPVKFIEWNTDRYPPGR